MRPLLSLLLLLSAAQPAPSSLPDVGGQDPAPGPDSDPRRAQDDEVLGYHLAEGPQFVCLTHWHSERCRERLAQEAVDLCQAALEQVGSLGPDPLSSWTEQVVVELHRGRKQYVNAVSGFLGDAAREDWAWSDPEQGVVHVTVAPMLPDRVGETIGLPPRTLQRLAEEATRLCLLRAAPVLAREDQAWLLEGLTRTLAQRALEVRGKGRSSLDFPGWSGAVSELQRLARAGELPGPAELAARARSADPVWGDTCRALVEWMLLEERADALAPVLAARLGAPADADPREDDLAALLAAEPGTGFLPWLLSLEPMWDERSPSLYDCAYGWIQTPVRGDSAVCFRRAPVGRESYRIEGEVMLFPGEKSAGQMNLLLGLREDGSYLSVAITGSNGVTVFEYDPEQDTFLGLARNLHVPVRHYDATRFVVEVKEGRLFVVVNGESVQYVEVTGRDMSGPWGVGAQRESAGVWLDVSLD